MNFGYYDKGENLGISVQSAKEHRPTPNFYGVIKTTGYIITMPCLIKINAKTVDNMFDW